MGAATAGTVGNQQVTALVISTYLHISKHLHISTYISTQSSGYIADISRPRHPQHDVRGGSWQTGLEGAAGSPAGGEVSVMVMS